ncbi:MAG: glycosyltransferase family 2 protein [Geminicoccaceae bacterium]
MTRTGPIVAVCACTFRRPSGLAALLDGIQSQTFDGGPEPELTIHIIDNDADGSARPFVEDRASNMPWPLIYGHEPRRGLVRARNACLDAVPEAAEWVAFIDDDEVPSPGWLSALLITAEAHDASIVAGPMQPAFEQPPPGWVIEGKFFELGPYGEGKPAALISTNNVLLAMGPVRRHGWRFDERFNLTGGEDEHFFTRAKRAGLKAVTSADALVTETVPARRVRLPWLLRRHFRMGTTLAMIDASLDGGSRTMALRFAKALGRMTVGLARLGHVVLGNRAGAVWGLCELARGAGTLSACGGFRYLEYDAKNYSSGLGEGKAGGTTP